MTPFPDWRAVSPELELLWKGSATIQAEAAAIQGQAGWFDLRRRDCDEHGADWCVFPIYLFDKLNLDNSAALPATCDLLARIPSLRSAAISRIGPGTEIQLHQGPPEISTFILRVLMGLDVRGECVIRIADEERPVLEGELLMFDDLMFHQSFNRSGAHRCVLILDLDRPQPLPLDLVEAPWAERAAGWPRGWEEVGAAGRYVPVEDFARGWATHRS